ncbi:odorant receptor, family H, subfamily 131, member 1, partial [Silurus asotus]
SNSSTYSFNVALYLFEKILLMELLTGIFVYINCLMIFTFMKKETFREETRYVLFAQTLIVDTALIFFSTMLGVLSYFQYTVHMVVCTFLFLIQTFFTCCTPLTLVAMCLERYVAICMPLRHADISTSRTRLYGLITIWTISCIIPVFSVIAFWAVAPPAALFSYVVCNAEVMIIEEWQAHGRAVIFINLFLFAVIIIVFTYIKIMIAARAASSEKKKSTNKSLRTVLLHGVQLFLCMIQFFNPYIEMALYKVDEATLRHVRYSNFIVFLFLPRSLSPLVYGVRDEKFFLVFRHYALCGTDHFFLKLFEIKNLKV